MSGYNCWTKHGERGVIMEEVGFIDPDKVHEVNIQDKPEKVKETLLRCFKRHRNKKEILLPYNFE